MKSNIMLKSNVFRRDGAYVHQDKAYLEQIHGRKFLKQMSDSGIRLNGQQDREMRGEAGCYHSSSTSYRGEQAFGKIKLQSGAFVESCRCENKECNAGSKTSFKYCMSLPYAKRIDREAPIIQEQETIDEIKLAYDTLGVSWDVIDEIIEIGVQAEEEPLPEEIIEEIESVTKTEIPIYKFEKIDDQDFIISAPFEQSILVNAGPGTGKTYTAIKRLEYIIEKGLADPEAILVLVYTRAAKKEILERLQQGVYSRRLPYEALNTHIYTLDSFAWWFLDSLEIPSGSDYDGTINLFINKSNVEDFPELEYLIIDELQDIVNLRAKMVLKILDLISCPVLLAGDQCQAIYDYECKTNFHPISSIEFYKNLDKKLRNQVVRYELCGNKRQTEDLAKFSDGFREKLLYDKESILSHFSHQICNIDKYQVPAEQFEINKNSRSKSAILCRTNGQAEWMSAILHSINISHNFLRKVGQTPSLHRWVADCLWDWAENTISKEKFEEIYRIRIGINSEEAWAALNIACGYDDNRGFIYLDELRNKILKSQENPEFLINKPCESLTVCTIHKAKGREFDNVFLLDDEFNPKQEQVEQEARVWYVGITRARKTLKILQKQFRWSFLRGYNDRRVKGTRWKRTNITVGLPGDVNENSFVFGSFQEVILRQQYIAENINIGDKIQIIDKKIIHNDIIIANLNDNIDDSFREAMEYMYSFPHRLDGMLFVTNIKTIVRKTFDENIPLFFREKHFWLGVEISGFPKIDWGQKKNESIL